jgi:hypothetical protein
VRIYNKDDKRRPPRSRTRWGLVQDLMVGSMVRRVFRRCGNVGRPRFGSAQESKSLLLLGGYMYMLHRAAMKSKPCRDKQEDALRPAQGGERRRFLRRRQQKPSEPCRKTLTFDCPWTPPTTTTQCTNLPFREGRGSIVTYSDETTCTVSMCANTIQAWTLLSRLLGLFYAR